jgi:hypothetical protein
MRKGLETSLGLLSRPKFDGGIASFSSWGRPWDGALQNPIWHFLLLIPLLHFLFFASISQLLQLYITSPPITIYFSTFLWLLIIVEMDIRLGFVRWIEVHYSTWKNRMLTKTTGRGSPCAGCRRRLIPEMGQHSGELHHQRDEAPCQTPSSIPLPAARLQFPTSAPHKSAFAEYLRLDQSPTYLSTYLPTYLPPYLSVPFDNLMNNDEIKEFV